MNRSSPSVAEIDIPGSPLDGSEGRSPFFRLIFDATPEALVVMNREGVVVIVNERFSTLFGHSQKHLAGHPFEEIVSPRFKAEFTAKRILSFDNPGPLTSETRLELYCVHKNGSEFPIEIAFGFIRSLDDSCIVGAIRNLTCTQRIEEKLKTLNRRHTLALNAANIGIWDWDVARDVLVWEKEMFALYGIHDLDSKNTFEIWKSAIHPDDAKRVHEAIQVARLGGEKFEAEFRIVWPNGQIREIRSLADVSQDEHGTTIRMTGVNTDVTERNSLARVLAEKSKALEASNTDLEHFAFAASHDLQEPLRKIISFAEILEGLLDAKAGGEPERILAVITKSAARMKILIEDLLKYSRVGRKDWQTTPVDLNAIVALILDTLETRTAESLAEVTVGELPVVTGDKTHLTLLFQNLIGNALKFRREGVPPRIEVSCRKKGENWEIWIEDNGIGIDAKYREKIFLLFARLHGRVKYEGTGIGLSMCRRTVEKLGGRIWVDSDNETGSVFKFTLPTALVPGNDSTKRI